MSQKAARESLRSSSKIVVIEAPAGCGKTHEAAELAAEFAIDLRSDQEVLLLAHTNAAVQEFRTRILNLGRRVRVLTIDAFALELIAAYAKPLGIPEKIRLGYPDGLPFQSLAPKLIELLSRAPSIARALASHYPIIIFDEHQDTRQDQHQAVMALSNVDREVRVRIFGDPMQAIYDFKNASLCEWQSILKCCDQAGELDEPHRWATNPELGRWIMMSREALRGGSHISFQNLPKGVTFDVVRKIVNAPPPKSSSIVPQIILPLHRILSQCNGSAAIIARNNAHVFGLKKALKDRLCVYEGGDPEDASAALDEALHFVGHPRELACLLIQILKKITSGLNSSVEATIIKSFKSSHIEFGRKSVVRPFLEMFLPLYGNPDILTWCSLAGLICDNPPVWLSIHLPEVLKQLKEVGSLPNPDPLDALDHVVRQRKYASRFPFRCITTIHKAKGRAFDHVILPFCGAGAFPNTHEGRKLLYVAISRARESLHFLLPESAASPLFDH